jgi:hypothetical protein
MGQMMKNACELVPGHVSELYAPHPEAADFRTLFKRFLLDPVLPILTLLSMAVLTMAILVLIVMAVANLEQSLQGGSASNDPWSEWPSGPAVSSGQPEYADFAGPADAAQGQGPWSGPQNDEPANTRLARTVPEP